MLRLALIENLRRVGARIAAGTIERNQAAEWADQMMDVAAHDPKSLILVIADMARSTPPMVSSFVAELARRLQGQSAALALPLTWIEQCLSESGLSIEQLVHAETQEQAGRPGLDQQHDRQPPVPGLDGLARVRRVDERRRDEAARGSGRALRPDGFRDPRPLSARRREDRERQPSVRKRGGAQGDPAGARGRRRRGRQERRRRSCSARRVLPDRQGSAAPRTRGARCAIRCPRRCAGVGRRIPLLLYLGAIAAITVGLTATLLAKAHADGVAGGLRVVLGIVLLLGASQLAVGMVNWLATLLVTPRPLPRMDFSKGLPPQSRTLVVVPTLLTSAEDIEGLVEALEVRFLANRDDQPAISAC